MVVFDLFMFENSGWSYLGQCQCRVNAIACVSSAVVLRRRFKTLNSERSTFFLKLIRKRVYCIFYQKSGQALFIIQKITTKKFFLVIKIEFGCSFFLIIMFRDRFVEIQTFVSVKTKHRNVGRAKFIITKKRLCGNYFCSEKFSVENKFKFSRSKRLFCSFWLEIYR